MSCIGTAPGLTGRLDRLLSQGKAKPFWGRSEESHLSCYTSGSQHTTCVAEDLINESCTDASGNVAMGISWVQNQLPLRKTSYQPPDYHCSMLSCCYSDPRTPANPQRDCKLRRDTRTCPTSSRAKPALWNKLFATTNSHCSGAAALPNLPLWGSLEATWACNILQLSDTQNQTHTQTTTITQSNNK